MASRAESALRSSADWRAHGRVLLPRYEDAERPFRRVREAALPVKAVGVVAVFIVVVALAVAHRAANVARSQGE